MMKMQSAMKNSKAALPLALSAFRPLLGGLSSPAAMGTGKLLYAMQADGNLVTYPGTPGKPGGATWASGTNAPNSYLTVTDAKQVRILSGTSVMWQKP